MTAPISEPTTLTIQAVRMPRTPEAVTSFIGKNPALIPGLSIEERSELLQVLGTALSSRAGVVQECAVIEGAAARLIKDFAGDTAILGQFANALGGAAWVQTNMTRLQTSELKSLALAMANSFKAPTVGARTIR